ncbi:MAG: type I DNA topoisomerase [Erysipelotrichaceae bacterium]
MKKKEKVKNLVIVESPSKASTIEKYLGSDYDVEASVGHICDLSTSGKSRLGIDVDNDFKTTYTISKEKKEVVKMLKDKVKNSENVLLATDPDREGEAIAYHLANTLGLDINDNNRVVFHEITKPEVTKAIVSPRQIDMQMVDSQETRRILDRIIGFKLSALLNSKIKSKSAGRVQSVALKLIVDREREIESFIPKEYWTVNAAFTKDEQDFVAELNKIDGIKAQIDNKQQADTILADCDNQLFEVVDVNKEVKHKKPKLAYTTSTLQQDAVSKLNMSSKRTMTVAQKLYEGINIGSATTGLITYMRSDSTRLSDVFINSAKAYITEKYGANYLGFYQQKVSKNAQDAHEAIRVTDINNEPAKIKQYLSNDEYRLYKLIYQRTLAALMADSLYNSTQINLKCNKYLFTASGRTLLFDGYLKVYDDHDEDKILPELAVSETLAADKLEAKQHFTEAPARYSEARLIKAMEENGIGRPSTYATIIDTIVKRGYVDLQRLNGSKVKVFVPTQQGILTNDKLQEFFSDIINVKYTADMETTLDEIAEGKQEKVASLHQFYDKFVDLLAFAKENMEKLQPVKTGQFCPQCGNELVIKKGKYGDFIACSNYPDCTYHQSIETDEQAQQDYGSCPQCGNKLVLKSGRYGKFIACSNYPNCTYIQKKDKPQPVDTGKICPQCGSHLVERVSRYGTKFIGCSNYPKCRYIEGSNKKSATARKKKNNE